MKLYAVQDGTVVFPRQPLLRLEGPFALIQLLETAVLNLVNFASLVCTNGSRMRLAAGDTKCVEFGLRRAQGPNGGFSASKYSYLGGFEGTSNVYAGFLCNIPVVGTIAHSFIMSFESVDDIEHCRVLKNTDLLDACMKYRQELGWYKTNLSELYAFISFAYAYPNNFSALVDSYSTEGSGVKNFILVALVLDDIGYKATGIRLDSGDLAYLSKFAKALWTEVGKKYHRDFSHF